MRSSSRNLVLVATGALALSTLSGTPALAAGGHVEAGHGSLLRAGLVGSSPATSPMASPVIAGINPGGKPWVTGESPARVRSDGRIKVRIRGLVIPAPVGDGTNPVASVVATLVCDDMVADSTEPFALDDAGNGRTSDTVMVPMQCADPVVLIQPAGSTAYIASTKMDDEDDDD